MPCGKKKRAAAKKREHESKIEPNKSPTHCELSSDFNSMPSGDSGKIEAGNEIAEQSLKDNLMKSVPLMDVNSSMIEKQTDIVSEDDVSVNEKASLKEEIIGTATNAEGTSVIEAFVDSLKENKKDEAVIDDFVEDRIVEENAVVADNLVHDYTKEDNQKIDSVEVDLVGKIESFSLKPIEELSDQEHREVKFSVEQMKNLTSFGIEIFGNIAQQIQGLKKKIEEDYDVILKAIAHSQKVLESLNAMQA